MLSMPDSGQAPGNTASVARLVWPLLLLIVGFWLVPLALTCQLQCVPGDLGDARFNNVVLEHFYRWLGGHEASLVSPGFFYPMPGALTFSDNHWGTAWIYAIFRALGWDRYQAFDLWFLCGYLLNFVASHYDDRRADVPVPALFKAIRFPARCGGDRFAAAPATELPVGRFVGSVGRSQSAVGHAHADAP